MKREELKEGIAVAALCASCGQIHAWKVAPSASLTHVAMERGWEAELCTCARQTVPLAYITCVLAEFAGLKP